MNEKKIDTVEFKKQFDALIIENNKLENIKDRNSDFCKALTEVCARLEKDIQQIKNIAKDIDPFSNTFTRKPRGKLSEVSNELYNKMIQGTQVTAQTVRSIYQDLNDAQIGYILTCLKKQKGVQIAKDGVKIRLFYQS